MGSLLCRSRIVLGFALVACRPTAATSSPIADAPASPSSTVVDLPAESAPEPEPEPDLPPVAEPAPPTHVAPTGFSPIPAKRKKGFPGIEFASVRAFAFDLHVGGQPTCGEVLAPDGAMARPVHGTG